jgi:L,D-transpeptidase catalytic domain
MLAVRRLNAQPLCATLLVAFVACIFSIETAHADFPFWPRSWWGAHAPSRHARHHRHTKPELAQDTRSQDTPAGPLQIIISIADQRISVYDNGLLIARSSVSTGVPRHPTPLGIFSVLSKQRWHRSNIYSAAPMPYMQRITWSGIALHAGVVPGHPASHGCIRLTPDFAVRLWRLTKRGTPVIIAPDDVQPVEIASPHLFAPKLGAAASLSESAGAVAVNNTTRVAGTHAPSTSDAGTKENTDQEVSSTAPGGTLPRRDETPISIFVSRKLSKLFVRRRFTPLFDVPVKIQNPDRPLGTHVFTAMEFQNASTSIHWTVVSLPEQSYSLSRDSTNQRKTPEQRIIATAAPTPLADASTALERIEIPQDAIDRISELLRPGSSLIISDHGISDETGTDTDFIVLTH